jgi:hypothetical protein
LNPDLEESQKFIQGDDEVISNQESFKYSSEKSFNHQAKLMQMYKSEVTTAAVTAVPRETTEMRYTQALNLRINKNRRTSQDEEIINKT